MSKQKVLINFEGTGAQAASLIKKFEGGEMFAEDTVLISFSGCQDARVGGRSLGLGYIDPDLDVIAKRIKKCFTGDKLSLVKLKQKFGDAVVIDGQLKDVEVESIAAIGFSRGGETCFSLARHLDDQDIPISIYAMDPVSGDSKLNEQNPYSEFQKNYDLSQLKNLVKAKVCLGVYTKKSEVGLPSGIHNKYFRQMAPQFNNNCDASISLFPVQNHFETNVRAFNELLAFFQESRLIHSIRYIYNESKDDLFFVPKILQQKFHSGVSGRTQISSRYKGQIFNKYLPLYPSLNLDHSFKTWQAKYALDQVVNFDKKMTLEKYIFQDKSMKGKALREFIVEFENILQYVISEYNFSALLLDELTALRQDVYSLVLNYLNDKNLTPEKKQAFIKDILDVSRKLKIKNLDDYMQDFMKNNVLIHPDLTRYIDESENFHNNPNQAKHRSYVPINFKNINTAEELAEMLYHLSERSRSARFDEYKQLIKQKVTNLDQLSEILRFLSPSKIEKTLSIVDIKQYVKSMDDVIAIMNKLDDYDQRKKVFHALKNHLNQIENPNVNLLKPYLSDNKYRNIMSYYKRFHANLKNRADSDEISYVSTSSSSTDNRSKQDPVEYDSDDDSDYDEQENKLPTRTIELALLQGNSTYLPIQLESIHANDSPSSIQRFLKQSSFELTKKVSELASSTALKQNLSETTYLRFIAKTEDNLNLEKIVQIFTDQDMLSELGDIVNGAIQYIKKNHPTTAVQVPETLTQPIENRQHHFAP